MRSSASKYFAVASVLSLFACSSAEDGGGTNNNYVQPMGGTGNTTTGGTTATAGTTQTAGTANAGTANAGATQGGAGGASGGTGGAAPGGAGGVSGGAGGVSGGAGGDSGGTAGAGGAAAGGDIIAVRPSTACNTAIAPDDGTYHIDTMGQKTDCARAGCGDLPDDGTWSETREYTIYKPPAYTNATPYRLVFLGPGCGGGSTGIYNYDNSADIIRVGVRPSENQQIQNSHGTNQNQGCFDDKEGDDSVDFVLYEDLYDLLDTQLCFDKNRVFFGGNSSGAWWSNEHGCHYAGDATRPVRGIMPNTGGLPSETQFKPTCTNAGMAGMWIHETGDTTNPFSGNIFAINRAMEVNGCQVGQTYDTAQFEDFPIPDNAANTCRRIMGCNELFPLVVCPLNGNGHGGHEDVVEPGVATFLDLFNAAPLAP
jgi:poly(3-hydroxybutyrate) depolymerase